MSDLATKMSLSATSDKAKHQGPSSCHVLAGAWGKTPSGAGKYFPNRHPRKHRFHLMVKSAVATACMLLAFVCQNATASFASTQFEAFIREKVNAYVKNNHYVQDLDHICVGDLEYKAIFEGDSRHNMFHDKMWEQGVVKTKLNEQFSKIFEVRKAATKAGMASYAKERDAYLTKIEKLWEAYEDAQFAHFENEQKRKAATKAGMALYAEEREAHLKKEDKYSSEYWSDYEKELLAHFRKEEVKRDAAEQQQRALEKMVDHIFETSFTVLKGNHKNNEGKPRELLFNTFKFNKAQIMAAEELVKELRYEPEGPVISYNNGKNVIVVSNLEINKDATFPTNHKRDEYYPDCYKVSGMFLEYGGWYGSRSWRKTDCEFLDIWLPISSKINGPTLMANYSRLVVVAEI